jgi:hypothetical protein
MFYKTSAPVKRPLSRTDHNPANDVLADSLPWPEMLLKPNSLQKSLFGNLADQQRRIIAALYPSLDDKQHSLALRMSQCGGSARVYIDPDSGKVRPWMSLCRSRMCPYCGKGRAAKIQKSLYHLICRMKQPKHLTLTYRSNDDPLALQLKQLKKAFRQLRGTADWKKNVRGGVFTVEVTRNVKTGLWHPHLHIVIDSNYIPQKRIVFLWSKYMPGGKNVWIRPVDNANGMGWEMAKYIGKAPTTRDWTVGAIREYQEASSHARFVQCFGSWSKYRLNVKYEKTEDAPRTYYVSIRRVVNLARHGVPVARDLAILIRRRWPLFQSFIDKELPKLPTKTIIERKRVVFDIAKNDGLPPPETGPPTKEKLDRLDFHLFAVFTRFSQMDEQQAFAVEDNFEAA